MSALDIITFPSEIHSGRTYTPSRQLHTSQSKRSYKQTSIPKSLQIEFKRQKDTFMTEISYNTDRNNNSQNSQFINQNNHSVRNISTAASGSYRSKILQTRKPIDFAIKTFQSASSRLEKFFNSAICKTEPNEKDDDLSDLENFRLRPTPKEQKRGLQHGILRKNTFQKSISQQNLAVTLQHIPILLDNLDQMEKEEQLPEEIQLLNNEQKLRQAVKKIDYSKQGNILAPLLESKVIESRKYDNRLNFLMRKSTSKLNQLKMQQYRINNPLVVQEIADLKQTIEELESQIQQFENQINDQQMYLVSKQHMKEVRYKDMIIKRDQNIDLLKMSTHLNRFLNKEAEQLIVDSKHIDTLFSQMVNEHRNKQTELQRQSVMSRDMKNKLYNENEVDRLIHLEKKMREYEKKEERNQKREEYLEKKRIQNKEIESVMEQQREYNAIIQQLDSQFLEFYSQNKNKVATSYLELLQFCIHVKQSTLNLKMEKQIFSKNVNDLKGEVQQLEKELRQLQLQNQFDFQVEGDIQQTLLKKKNVVEEADLIFKQPAQNNSQIYQIDNIEIDNFEIQKILHVNQTKESLSQDIIFKSINGIKDLHTLFFSKLNNIPFDDLIKLKKKQFNENNLESSIEQFTNSIKTLINIIEEKEDIKRNEQSLQMDEMDNRLETNNAQPNPKYYYTYVEL